MAAETASAAPVCPGTKLQPANQYQAGRGTYVAEEHVVASIVGFVRTVEPSEGSDDVRPVLEVTRKGTEPIVPKTGDTVTAKVTKVNPRMANCEILCVGTRPLEQNFSGIIRKQDVRATEIDKVEIYGSFRPGDVVRADVISLGDARSYYLSTAKNELGVVFARSVAGHPMLPVSWQEMQCPETKLVEKRKVAKQ